MPKRINDLSWLQEFLEEKVLVYNQVRFIEEDPISIVHSFVRKEDIEIAGLLMATIAWGNRRTIIRNGARMMEIMEASPFEFVSGFSRKEEKKILQSSFVHRTFNANDFVFFCRALKSVLKEWGSLEDVFYQGFSKGNGDAGIAISFFRNELLKQKHQARQTKHISDPSSNSAAKRINMYLRWMVRNDNKGVDFGLWKSISPSWLSIPLDVHTGNISRELGLLQRKANDWKAVQELDSALRKFDPKDPVKYDFALFGLGAYGWKDPF